MVSSSKTIHAPLALQSSKQGPDMPHDSPRHSLPAQKTSMIRRFLRTSTKDSQPLSVQTAAGPTLLDSKQECTQPPYSSSSTMPSTGSSEANGGSSLMLSPPTLSAKTASLATKELPARKPHGSLARVKQTLVRKINARRVGADPRPSSCIPSSPSSPSSRASTSSASSASEPRSVAASPRPSTDSSTQPSAADPTLDRSQSKLKRWQTRSTNKLKTWLNVHPTQRELTTVDGSQDRPEINQQQAFEPTPATPTPDLEVHSAEVAIQEHSAAAGSLVVSQDLLPLSGPLSPQDSKLLHRRRASEHQPFVYTSALQTLRDDHASYFRPLRSLSRRSLDGPGRIPVRSSSLPRSFGTASSASWNRQPLEPEEGHLPALSSPPALAAPYTTLDNILEDSKETTIMDRANTEAPAEYSEEAAAVVSEALSTNCAVSLPHPFDSADELAMPQPCSPLLIQELQGASFILSAWAEASVSTLPHGRTRLDVSVLSRKRRHCKARRLSDISVLVAKKPRNVRRETSKRRGGAACLRAAQSDSPERVAGDQTGHDPFESASLCSADHGTKRASVVGTPARSLANDEDQASNPLDFLETHQTPSLPTDAYTPDGSYPTHQADSISNREIPCGIVTEMLFSVNPLLKARWQPKSTVYALSAIGFWSSLHRQESLVV